MCEAGFAYRTIGPDIRIQGEDVFIELTTAGQEAAHLARAADNPECAVALFAFYVIVL